MSAGNTQQGRLGLSSGCECFEAVGGVRHVESEQGDQTGWRKGEKQDQESEGDWLGGKRGVGG